MMIRGYRQKSRALARVRIQLRPRDRIRWTLHRHGALIPLRRHRPLVGPHRAPLQAPEPPLAQGRTSPNCSTASTGSEGRVGHEDGGSTGTRPLRSPWEERDVSEKGGVRFRRSRFDAALDPVVVHPRCGLDRLELIDGRTSTSTSPTGMVCDRRRVPDEGPDKEGANAKGRGARQAFGRTSRAHSTKRALVAERQAPVCLRAM